MTATGARLSLPILLLCPVPGLQKLLSLELELHGYTPLVADTPTDIRAIEAAAPALILLDMDTPGLPPVRAIRARMDAPIIMLADMVDPALRFYSVKLGVDDAFGKPFDTGALLERIDTLLRQHQGTAAMRPTVVLPGGVAIDLEHDLVLKAGGPVTLPDDQWQVLRCLAEHAGALVPTETLLVSAWGPEYRNEQAFLRLHIERLRKKLGGGETRTPVITEVEGRGYRLERIHTGTNPA